MSTLSVESSLYTPSKRKCLNNNLRLAYLKRQRCIIQTDTANMFYHTHFAYCIIFLLFHLFLLLLLSNLFSSSLVVSRVPPHSPASFSANIFLPFHLFPLCSLSYFIHTSLRLGRGYITFISTPLHFFFIFIFILFLFLF